MNKRISILAAVAALALSGPAFADSMGKSSPSSETSATEKGPTGNGGMAGTPATTETPNVEGKSGSQSGPKTTDKMAPQDKY